MNRLQELSEKVESLNKEMDSLRNINNLYTYYPDDLSTAQSVWNLMSEDEKKNFTDELMTTDAASEGIAEAWMLWIRRDVGRLTEEEIQIIVDRVETYLYGLVKDLGRETFDVSPDDIEDYDLSIENENEISINSLDVTIDLRDVDLNYSEESIRKIIKSVVDGNESLMH
jgi:sulfatase maturation enzyme AslB (radical SAM superfamily)